MGATREKQLVALRALLGVPYLWGAKGTFLWLPGGRVQSLASLALDCSGAYTYSLLLAGGPDIRLSESSGTLFRERAPALGPAPGVLAFYGPGLAEHVMVCMDERRVIGASGGDSTTTSLEEAQRRGARVKIEQLHYRTDLIGFREPHLPSEKSMADVPVAAVPIHPFALTLTKILSAVGGVLAIGCQLIQAIESMQGTHVQSWELMGGSALGVILLAGVHWGFLTATTDAQATAAKLAATTQLGQLAGSVITIVPGGPVVQGPPPVAPVATSAIWTGPIRPPVPMSP